MSCHIINPVVHISVTNGKFFRTWDRFKTSTGAGILVWGLRKFELFSLRGLTLEECPRGAVGDRGSAKKKTITKLPAVGLARGGG